MRARYGRGLVVGVAASLMVMLLAPAAGANEGSDEPATADTLVDRVVAAAEEGEASPEELAEQLSLPEEGEGSLSFDAADRIVIAVMFQASPDDDLLARIGEIGQVQSVQESFASATVLVEPERLSEILEVPGVLSAMPALAPIVGSLGGEFRASAHTASQVLPAANRSDGTFCGPIEIEADSPLRADEAREVFEAYGTGVTVGIISDSYDTSFAALTSASEDVESGALPGPGNPCGWEEPVEVLADGPPDRTDEGRAMAQLIHGIAPGAKLLFATAGGHEGEMAQNILELVDAGADIIVDDINWVTEFTYQQGMLAEAIRSAREANVPYLASAGNANGIGTVGESAGKPIVSWETDAYRPMACPAWVLQGEEDPLQGTYFDCLDFDPDPAIDTPYDTLHVRDIGVDATASFIMVGSIGEPVYGVTTDYEWRIFEVDALTGDSVMLGDSITRLSTAHPNFYGMVDAPYGSELRTVMVRKNPAGATSLPAVFTTFLRGGDSFEARAHLGNGTTDRVGSVTFGHSRDGSATSVASLVWDEPTVVREYSSPGGGTLLFGPVESSHGNEPSAPFPDPVRVDTPHVAAVDGTVTTFFGLNEGTEEYPEFRFYGTSAAAPNAAAVAALALSYAPGLPQDELTRLLIETAADDIENPYSPGLEDHNVYGAGRVDALALLEALEPSPAELFESEVTHDSVAVEWLPGSASGFLLSIYDGEPTPEHELMIESLAAGTSEYRFDGLESETEYTLQLVSYSEYLAMGRADTLLITTHAAGSDAVDGEVDEDAAVDAAVDEDVDAMDETEEADGTDAGAGGADGTDRDGGTDARDGDRATSGHDLPSTGAGDQLPWLLGAGAVVLAGIILAGVSILRRRRRDKLEE